MKVGRCRCGKRIDEDGQNCTWHTSVQAKALQQIIATAQEPPLLGLKTLRNRLRAVIEKDRG